MGTIKLKTQRRKKDNYTLPGKPMTKKEFVAMIKAAEKGPFIDGEKFKERWEKRLRNTE
ncbi:MAG: hypothetical protein IIA88_05465 [Bacteroidetes bacterium]|nr:hypothetical protein [Bacteroidota bacterium]